MAETQNDPKETQNPENSPPSPESDPEKAFWGKFETTLDGWFDKKMKSMREQGNSRTGGRNTLPKMVADLFFGPAEKS